MRVPSPRTKSLPRRSGRKGKGARGVPSSPSPPCRACAPDAGTCPWWSRVACARIETEAGVQSPTTEKQPSTNQPVHTIRHRRLKATVWKNQTEKGVIYNVTIVRSYRVGEQWHDSQSFSYNDLMNVAKLLYDAHSFISSLLSRSEVGARRRPKAVKS